MRNWPTIVATWVGVISAVTGGFFALQAYREDVAKRVDGRVAGVFARIESFNEPDFRRLRDKMDQEALARRICDTRVQSDAVFLGEGLTLNELNAFVDFFDLVALCADAQLCEPELTAQYFSPYANNVWLTVQPFIERARASAQAEGGLAFGRGLERLATNPTPIDEACGANFTGPLSN